MFNRILKAYQNRRKEQQTAQEFMDEREVTNAMYLRLFSTEDGKRVLEHLVQTNLAVPIAVKGSDMLDIGVMQGRANLVNEIIQRMEVARVS